MGPDFSIHGFDNGAGGAFDNGAWNLDPPKISVFVVFRRSLARTSYQTSFAEISFLGLGAFPGTELCPNKKARQKCCTDESPRVVILWFVFDFWSPSENSSIKIGFFDKEPSENAVLGSKLGLLRKEVLITFARPKKKRDVFRAPPSREHGFPVCRCRTKTDETTVNVVYSVSAPKTNFCRRLLENRLFPRFRARGAR